MEGGSYDWCPASTIYGYDSGVGFARTWIAVMPVGCFFGCVIAAGMVVVNNRGAARDGMEGGLESDEAVMLERIVV